MTRLLLSATLVFATATSALAHGPHHHGGSGRDRASFGNDITVEAGETVSDVACAFCSVYLHGDVQGDVAVLFGTVTLDAGHTVGGDVAILGGDLVAGEGAAVHGDVAIGAGELRLAPTASVHGDRAVLPGRFWLLVPLAPLLVLAGIVWLIVWLVRRNRYGSPYYPGRRF